MSRTLHQTVERTAAWRGGTRIRLHFHERGGEPIPALLMLPPGAGPHPGALLLHGYSSRKEHLADGFGGALLARGIASLAIDLPLHGTRADPVQAQSARNPLAAVRLWRLAQREAALALRYLGARAEVDPGCLAVAGYSLGSFLAVMLAAADPGVRAVVLAAGGDLPTGTPFAAVARTVADPLRAVRRLSGRPLLMLHGQNDRTVKPEQARRLFEAAGEPKELRWWSSGHILPAQAVDDAAGWLQERLRGGSRSAIA
jgi:uncharacterized protein